MKRLSLVFMILFFTFYSALALECNWNIGDEFKFKNEITTKMVTKASLQKSILSTYVSTILTQKVISKDNDTYMVLCTVTNPVLKVNGVKKDARNLEKVFTMKVAKDGKVLETVGINSVDLSSLSFQLPKEIKKGYTWSNYIKIKKAVIPVTIKNTYTIVGFEKVMGRKCAVIKMKGQTVNPSKRLDSRLIVKSSGKMYLDLNKGIVIKSNATVRVNATKRMFLQGQNRLVTTTSVMNIKSQLIEK